MTACNSFGRSSTTAAIDRLGKTEIFALECLAHQTGKNATGKNMLICQDAIKTATEKNKIQIRKSIIKECKKETEFFKNKDACLLFYTR